jgi:FixJ family two-component response regulator
MTQDPSHDVAVVDDNMAVRDSFRFLLELAGFPVATYDSAAAFLRRDPLWPRCLIVDQHMPGMTGLELAAWLSEQGIRLPVLLITAAPSPAVIARAGKIGVLGVLEKPPRDDEIIAFITAQR